MQISNLGETYENNFIGKVIASSIRNLGYRNNLHIREDFQVWSSVTDLEVCFLCILGRYVRFGSNVVVESKMVSFSLKKFIDIERFKETASKFLYCKIYQEKDRLILKW